MKHDDNTVEQILAMSRQGMSSRQISHALWGTSSKKSSVNDILARMREDTGLVQAITSKLKADSDQYIKTVRDAKPCGTHLVIPDTQVKPDVCLDHLALLGKYIVDKRPDVIVHLGDHADMESLSSYDKGKRSAEGKRVAKDIEAAKRGMEVLLKPLRKLQKKQAESGEEVYRPRMVLTLGNHECLTPDTEVLTKEGFKTIDAVTLDDLVLTLDAEGFSAWKKPNSIIEKFYDGDIYKWESRSFSASVTENHRMLVDVNGKQRYKLAKDLTKNFKVYQSAKNTTGRNYQDDFLKLCAWLSTDSYFSDGNQVYLYQRESNAHKIRDVLDNLGVKYNESTKHRNIDEICGKKLLKSPEACVTFTLQARDLVSFPVKSNKVLPSICDTFTEDDWDIFLETLVDADGTIPTKAVNSRVVYGKKEFCDSVQAFSVRFGWVASLTEYRTGHWRVNLCKQQVRRQENIKPSVSNYKGMVYCLEIENTNFMVRHNNKCHFTGNCRIDRHVDANPELHGFLSIDSLGYKQFGWEVYDFLKPVTIDGVVYCHYMANPFSGKPYSGSAQNILNKVGESFTVGHKQTLDIATRFLPASGKQQWGIVAGAFYLHQEGYKGHQGNHHWRGFIVKHNVSEGSYNPMFVDVEYLEKKYGR